MQISHNTQRVIKQPLLSHEAINPQFFAQQEMEAVLLITCLITYRDHRQKKKTLCRQANLKSGSPPKHKVVSSGGPFCVFVSVNEDQAF